MNALSHFCHWSLNDVRINVTDLRAVSLVDIVDLIVESL